MSSNGDNDPDWMAWLAWRDGTTLEAAPSAALERRLRDDDAFRAMVLADARLDDELGILLADDGTAFTARVRADLQALEHETAFVHRVRKQLEHQQRPQSRRIRRRRPATAFPLWPGLLAVAALIAVVIVVTGRPDQRPAPAGWSCLAANDPALIGPLARDAVFAVDSGEATLNGPLGQRVVLTRGRIRVDGDHLHLLAGGCDSTVPSLPVGRSYAVITPQATCTVVGTAFSVTIDHGATHLAVREGTVRFTAAGQSRLVHAGENARHPLPASPPVTPLLPTVTTPAPAAAPLVHYAFSQPGPSVTDQGRLGLHLRIEDARHVAWAADGLRLLQPTRLRAPGNALRDALVASRACTILVECTPAAAQAGFDTAAIGPARLLTLSQGPTSRCFTLGQGELDLPTAIWSFRLRHGPDTSARNLNGLPSTWIPLTTTRQRLAITFAAQGVRWFRDGKAIAEERKITSCVFTQWNADTDWCIGDEAGNLDTDHRPWLGTLHRLEIHDRVLDEAVIAEW